MEGRRRSPADARASTTFTPTLSPAAATSRIDTLPSPALTESDSVETVSADSVRPADKCSATAWIDGHDASPVATRLMEAPA